jgi:hypothetical protein
MKVRLLPVGVLFATLLAACAGAPPEAEKTVDELLAEKGLEIVEELDRLTVFNVHSWQYVNDHNVILEEGVSRRYLVELRNSCPETQWAQRIAFTSFGRIVENTDRILVTNGGGRVDRCTMKTFYRLEKTGG